MLAGESLVAMALREISDQRGTLAKYLSLSIPVSEKLSDRPRRLLSLVIWRMRALESSAVLPV